MTKFLLKINGELHGPDGICRPRAANEWDGREIMMPWEGPRPSSYIDRTSGPTVQPGDELFIWTHEDEAFGNGLGITATAVADAIREDGNRLAIRLRDTTLIPRPFGFRLLGDRAEASPLLAIMDSDRSPRAWIVSEEDAAFLAGLIDEFGQPISAAVTAAYLDPWSLAITQGLGEIRAAIAERKTRITKARPGQQAFRAEAMSRHGGKCVLTGCRVPEAIEAAHVIPHTGDPQFERPDNSLVLRRDVHALFDTFLISIHPQSGRVEVAPKLLDTVYGKLKGRDVDHKLAKQVLEFHFRQFRAARDSEGRS